LLLSATHTLLCKSTAIPNGCDSAAAWRVRVAAIPAHGSTLHAAELNGESHSLISPLIESATHRFPELSTVIPKGVHRLSGPSPLESRALVPSLHSYETKSCCPTTMSAGAPLVSELIFFHPSTRLLLVSAT